MAAEKKPTPTSTEHKFLFDKKNYLLFVLGALLIIVGFMLMAGGGSKDPAVYSKEVFSETRITVAPIMILLGFIVTVFGIMVKPKE